MSHFGSEKRTVHGRNRTSNGSPSSISPNEGASAFRAVNLMGDTLGAHVGFAKHPCRAGCRITPLRFSEVPEYPRCVRKPCRSFTLRPSSRDGGVAGGPKPCCQRPRRPIIDFSRAGQCVAFGPSPMGDFPTESQPRYPATDSGTSQDSFWGRSKKTHAQLSCFPESPEARRILLAALFWRYQFSFLFREVHMAPSILSSGAEMENPHGVPKKGAEPWAAEL